MKTVIRNPELGLTMPLIAYKASPRWIHLAIGIIGFTATLLAAYGFYAGDRIYRLEEPLVDAVREIKLEAAAAMQWFDRAGREFSSPEATDLWRDVDRAFWHLRTSLDDSELFQESLRENDDPHLKAALASVYEKLTALERLTQKGLGGNQIDIDSQQSKETYTTFLEALDRLEEGLIQVRTKTLRRFRYSQGLLLCISLGMTVGAGLIYQRFERQRAKNLHDLHRAVNRMEAEMAVRWKVEEDLRRARGESEELVALRTTELRAANEKLMEEIDDRRRIEARLQENGAMLQAVFDGISDPLVLVNQEMKIKVMNRAAGAYYGFDKTGDVTGKVCRNAVGKECICDHCQIPEAVVGGLKRTFERRGLMDPRRLEQVTIYPVSGDRFKAGDAVIRVTDITEARIIQQNLIRSEKMASLGVLVSSVAHEINNPNNFISFNIPILRGYLEKLMPLIDRHAALKPGFELFNMPYDELRRDLFKLLENIEHGSQRISAFISNLKEFGETRENRRQRWVDLTSIINKVVDMCRNKVKRSVKSFELEIPGNLPAVYTEPLALEQVLINLVINAVQALDKTDSQVKLSVSMTNGSEVDPKAVCISVSDNGCGMDEEVRKNIFDPFFTTKQPGEGTGLGLYVCHNLIESLGGRIDVASEVGAGSTFSVVLPVQPPEPGDSERSSGQVREGHGQ